MLTSEPQPPLTGENRDFPRYSIPSYLRDCHEQRGLTVGEAKALARDIRIWLIGQGHETVDEFEEP